MEMEKQPPNDWCGKEYAFRTHTACEYFPCHDGADRDNFNCLFCYCPLYLFGERCGGDFTYTDSGVKDCSACLIPHKRENYGYITERFRELVKERENAPGRQKNTAVIPVKRLHSGAILPTYGSGFSAGADLYASIGAEITVGPGETAMIPTGLAMEIPAGYAGLVYARSGLASKRGLAPANKVGVIDSDYRGEIIVALHNHSTASASVMPGERIAQLVVTPVLTAAFIETDELSGTERGAGGFGSTGRT